LGGRALSRTLPATGDVLFHLGAFLLPVDVAGLAVQGGWGWRSLLLAEGLVGVVALGGLGRAKRPVLRSARGRSVVAGAGQGPVASGPPGGFVVPGAGPGLVASGFPGGSVVPGASRGLVGAPGGSVVLRVAGAAAVPVLAAGVAGLTPLPAGAVLIAIAIAADWLGMRAIAGALTPVSPSEGTGWRRAAAAWAALAGLAPLAGVVLVAVTGALDAGRGPGGISTHLGAGTLTDLGLLGRPLALTAGITGLVAAWVLGRRARARSDAALAFLALGCVATGGLATVVTPGLTAGAGLVAAAATFLGLEVATWLAGRDPFWRPVLRSVAGIAEVVVSVPTALGSGALIALAAVLGLTGELGTWSGPAAVALALLAAAWLAADLRHAAPPATGRASRLAADRPDAAPTTAPEEAIRNCAPGTTAAVAAGAQNLGPTASPAGVGAGALLRTIARGGGREGAFVLAALAAVGSVVAATSSPAAAAVALVAVAAAAVGSARTSAPLVAAS
ncbi:MAG TPA: hypothetical protein VGL92_01485, partial [Acidimicrobiia bacterium]